MQTVKYRYDAVRFSPIRSEQYPFQILSSADTFELVIELTLEEAQDLHKSLGVLIREVDSIV